MELPLTGLYILQHVHGVSSGGEGRHCVARTHGKLGDPLDFPLIPPFSFPLFVGDVGHSEAVARCGLGAAGCAPGGHAARNRRYPTHHITASACVRLDMFGLMLPSCDYHMTVT